MTPHKAEERWLVRPLSDVDRLPPRVIRYVVAALLAVSMAPALWLLPDDLSPQARIALIVIMLCVIGWTLTDLGDTVVALAAALALALSGTISTDTFYRSLGHELIWLMIAAFVMSGVMQTTGLIQRCLLPIIPTRTTIAKLFYVTSGVIASTAFVVPSTSGRAALLLPVFVVLAQQLRRRVYIRALSLLFPTIILLSACGSLIGAGAHLIVVDIIAEKAGRSIGFAEWALLTLPIAIATCIGATWIILKLFLSPRLRQRTLTLASPPSKPWNHTQRMLCTILAATIALWMTTAWHTFDTGLIAIAGALAMMVAARSQMHPRAAFKSVEIELIVFLAATFVVAQALIETGADRWLASSLLIWLPSSGFHDRNLIVGLVVGISLASHLVVTSRTARASVLLSTIILPLAGMQFDLIVLALAMIVGTGYCQTLTSSAKPVALFANAGVATFARADLMRLSAALLPMMFTCIMIFAVFVWPEQVR